MDEKIKSALKPLLERAEELNWKVTESENCITLQSTSPAGHDGSLEIYVDDLVEGIDIKKYFVNQLKEMHETFDVSQEAYYWLDSTGHGTNGAPYEMCDVYRDMESVKNMYYELYSELEKMEEK